MEEGIVFHDRTDAGQRLAQRLDQYKNKPDTLVLALPRGGVPVGYEVAQALQLPLDIFVVRKLGVPYQKELALGAIASGGVTYFNNQLIAELGISQAEIDHIITTEKSEMERREQCYRAGQPFSNVKGKTILLVDDGIATGSTMRAALLALKKLSPQKIILAVPVASESTLSGLSPLVDQVICLHSVKVFFGVSSFYKHFPQTTDFIVCRLLGHPEDTHE